MKKEVKELVEKFNNCEEEVEVFIADAETDGIFEKVQEELDTTLIYDEEDFTLMTVERFKDYYRNYIEEYLENDEWEYEKPLSLMEYARENYRVYE